MKDDKKYHLSWRTLEDGVLHGKCEKVDSYVTANPDDALNRLQDVMSDPNVVGFYFGWHK